MQNQNSHENFLTVEFGQKQRSHQERTNERPSKFDFEKNLTSRVRSPTGESAHKLKLKDYLRLTSITKRSNSTSSKVNQSEPKSPSLQHEENKFDINGSVKVLKEELKSDLTVCYQKIHDLMGKIDKSICYGDSQEEKYDELIFLCELHRNVKEAILSGLDRTNSLVSDHREMQFFKYGDKNTLIIPDELKKSSVSGRRRPSGLHATRRNSRVDSSNISNLGNSIIGN